MGGTWNRPKVVRAVRSEHHPRRRVDPFGFFPCSCDELVVHATDGETLGSDLVECAEHGIVVTLTELFRHIAPPGQRR